MWADDPHFDAARHIHLHRVRPDGFDQALSGRAMVGPLDLERPLWELHLFTGLAGGRFAVLGQAAPRARPTGCARSSSGSACSTTSAVRRSASAGHPSGTAGRPGSGSGAGRCGRYCGTGRPGARAAGTGARRGPRGRRAAGPVRTGSSPGPTCCWALVRSAAGQVPALARHCGQTVDIAASVLRSVVPPGPDSPWAAAASGRQLARVRVDLHDVHQIRRRHGGTVHDVLLAVVTGALRQWLEARGHAPEEVTLRALVPVSRRRRSADQSAGNSLSGYLCRLPVAEPDPLARLLLVRAELDRHKTAAPDRGAGALPVLANRLPSAVHRLAAPTAGLAAPMLFDTVVTSVPLPNVPLHLAGAELAEVYPVVPLPHGHALGIAITTYRGAAHLTLHADVDAMPDLGRLAGTVPAELATLLALPQAS